MTVRYETRQPEFGHYGIPALPSTRVAPPRVDGATASLERRVESLLRPGRDTLVIARVPAVHVAADVQVLS